MFRCLTVALTGIILLPNTGFSGDTPENTTKKSLTKALFPDLKHHNVMIKGKVYVKEAPSTSQTERGTETTEKDSEVVGVLSANIVNQVQKSLVKSERAQLAKATKQSAECQCQFCGVTGEEHAPDSANCPSHGPYPSCQACGGCLTPPPGTAP